jgi:hypothetical protein
MTISELLEHRGLWTLLGVLVGFGFTEISSRVKKRRERIDCKAALLDEVRFNLEQSKDKIDILDQVIRALSEKEFLSTKCGRYSTTEFNSFFYITVPILTNVEKDNLRHLNSFYLKIDALLDEFDSQFRSDIEGSEKRDATIESVYKGHIIQLTDIRDSVSTHISLSEKLMSGEPVDLFATK